MEADVVVIGGGSTGSSILYHLAKNGAKSPLLVERGPSIASGQTAMSTALVRTHYSVPLVAKMALLSYRFFMDFGTNLGGRNAGFVETGLIIGFDRLSARALSASLDAFRESGIDSRKVDLDEVRRLEPALDATAFSAVVYEPHAGYAEPSATATAFASAAEELGARVLTNTTVSEIRRTSGGYSVSTNRGEVSAQRAVIATGVWSPPLFAGLGVKVPLKIVRHPVAKFRRPSEYQGLRPVVFDFPRAVYYKPEGRSLLFAGSIDSELDESGESSDPDRYDRGVTFEEAEKFTRLTSGTFPVMENGHYEGGYSGVYDNSPDQQPIVDELSDYGLPGLYCLVGLSGHGFKLCPEFGRMMASLVTLGEFEDYDVSVFGLKRFERGRLIRGGYSVSTIG